MYRAGGLLATLLALGIWLPLTPAQADAPGGLTNLATGLCISGNGGGPGSTPTQQRCDVGSNNGDYEQYWVPVDMGLGGAQIHNDGNKAHHGLCLTNVGNAAQPGAVLTLQACKSDVGGTQTFYVNPTVGGGVSLVAEKSNYQPNGFCASSSGGVGPKLVLEPCNKGKNQSFSGFTDAGEPGAPGPEPPGR
jgi:Ricin-type beta-trefoil lectin domain